MIAPEHVFLPATGVEAATFGGELVLLDATGRMLRGLNATGARVWQLVDGRRTVAEVARTLAAENGIDEARALEDVCGFLQALLERKLILP